MFAGHGQTFPGATVPFAAVQLSPDTQVAGWDACAGYHCSDSTLLGFSYTHLSGTGVADYGDILFLPVLGKPGAKNRPRFSHNKEWVVYKAQDLKLVRTVALKFLQDHLTAMTLNKLDSSRKSKPLCQTLCLIVESTEIRTSPGSQQKTR